MRHWAFVLPALAASGLFVQSSLAQAVVTPGPTVTQSPAVTQAPSWPPNQTFAAGAPSVVEAPPANLVVGAPVLAPGIFAPLPVIAPHLVAPAIGVRPLAPVLAYRPVVPVVAPARVLYPGAVVRTKVYVWGQPIRNFWRRVLP